MSVNAHDPVQFKPVAKQLSPEQVEKLQLEACEMQMALQLLREGRVLGANGSKMQLTSIVDINAFQRFKEVAAVKKTKLEDRKTRDFISEIDCTSARNREDVAEEGEESRRSDEMELDLSIVPPGLQLRAR